MYRVMIADADLTYCEVIQGWILEKYGAEIEMEIITERSYYTETFKTRHELDLMIVSRDFRTTSVIWPHLSLSAESVRGSGKVWQN